MKKYDTYKDSGNQWIGQVPEHWSVRKLKHIVSSIKSGGTPTSSNDTFYSEDGFPWVAIGDMSSSSYVLDTQKHITKAGVDDKGLTLYPVGTLLYSIYATIGKVSELRVPAYINQAILALVPKDDTYQQFLKYSLIAQEKYVYSLSNSNIQANLNAEIVSNLLCPLPPLTEQEAIANFLDKKTGEIDQAIALFEQEKTDLQAYSKAIISETVTKGLNPNAKLKDSGIQWIGQIPEEWSVVKMKHLLDGTLTYGANEPAESDNKEWPRYIRITDIAENGSLKESTFKSLSPDKAENYLLQKGDVLFARSGATVGKTFLFEEKYPACFAGYLIKATPNKAKLNSKFLYFYTVSDAYESWKNSVYIKSTIQNIGADKYSLLPISIPPLSEQEAIVAFLDQKTSAIDTAIERINAQITELQAYRTALISEAVTGKIDVRNQ